MKSNISMREKILCSYFIRIKFLSAFGSNISQYLPFAFFFIFLFLKVNYVGSKKGADKPKKQKEKIAPMCDSLMYEEGLLLVKK